MATKPAADKKVAPHAEDTAGAAPLLCAISGTTTGRGDDAVLGGVATDAGGIVSSSLGDDGAKVAGPSDGPGPGDRAVEAGACAACALAVAWAAAWRTSAPQAPVPEPGGRAWCQSTSRLLSTQ